MITLLLLLGIWGILWSADDADVWTKDTTTFQLKEQSSPPRHHPATKHHTQQQPQQSSSPLNDKTLHWDNVQYPHAWLAYEQQQQQQQQQGDDPLSSSTSYNTNTIPRTNKPPYMILLTEYGWNHPSERHGLSFARSRRSTEFYQAIIHHPYFHPTAYSRDIVMKNPQNQTYRYDADNTTTTYYVFLDVETCYESNYPHYGKSYYGNCDDTGVVGSSRWWWWTPQQRRTRKRRKYTSFYIKHGRPRSAACYDFSNCHYIRSELQQNPIFQPEHDNNNKLILLDCRGNGQDVSFRHGDQGSSPHIALVSLSATAAQLNLALGDQGLPPPTLQQIPYRQPRGQVVVAVGASHDDEDDASSVTPQYQQEIVQENCSSLSDNSSSSSQRKYFLSFSGDYHRHEVRLALAQLDNVRTQTHHPSSSNTTTTTTTPLVLITDTKDLSESTNGLTYPELLLSSQYVAVPRGDNLYSYRFSEVLSSGAIPVLIHNAEWVLPFSSDLVDWTKCVIRLAAHQINNETTISLLQQMSSPAQVCQRRQYCTWIYERYMMNASATMQGILDGLQAHQQPPQHKMN